MKKFLFSLCLSAAAAGGCGPPPTPEILYGEGIVEKVIRADRRSIVAHEDIPDFMDAMTMSFEVDKPSLLDEFRPGDRIRFTLERTKLTLYMVAAEKIVDDSETSEPDLE